MSAYWRIWDRMTCRQLHPRHVHCCWYPLRDENAVTELPCGIDSSHCQLYSLQYDVCAVRLATAVMVDDAWEGEQQPWHCCGFLGRNFSSWLPYHLVSRSCSRSRCLATGPLQSLSLRCLTSRGPDEQPALLSPTGRISVQHVAEALMRTVWQQQQLSGSGEVVGVSEQGGRYPYSQKLQPGSPESWSRYQRRNSRQQCGWLGLAAHTRQRHAAWSLVRGDTSNVLR